MGGNGIYLGLARHQERGGGAGSAVEGERATREAERDASEEDPCLLTGTVAVAKYATVAVLVSFGPHPTSPLHRFRRYTLHTFYYMTDDSYYYNRHISNIQQQIIWKPLVCCLFVFETLDSLVVVQGSENDGLAFAYKMGQHRVA